MREKNTRIDIRITSIAKKTLEQAAQALETNLSAFILDAAISKAREVIAQSQIIHLHRSEAERFMAALENFSKPNKELKALFKKHGAKKLSDKK